MSGPEINNPAPGGILIVGRDYGEREVEKGRPFVGPAGELLDEVLSFAGWRRQDVNITNVKNKRPPNNDFTKHSERDIEEGLAETVIWEAAQLRSQPSLMRTKSLLALMAGVGALGALLLRGRRK